MKKILSFIVLLAGVISFTSCGKDDATYNPVPSLEVTKADVLFEAEGGTGSITVNASSSLAVSVEGNWLTVSASGNTVSVVAPPNASLNGRSAKITIKADNAQAVVTATQKGSIYGVVGGLSYELSDLADASVSVPVVHTSEVTVKSLTEWLTASFNNETNEIEVVAQSNDGEEERVGYVAFATGNMKDTLVIVQSGMVFELDKTSLTVGNAGGTEKVNVKHSKPVTVETSADWLKCSFNSKTGVLSINVAKNTALARQGTITVKSGTSEKTISVIQYDPASLADQIVGNYYFTFYDGNGALKYLPAMLTEEALQIPALSWAIPVTIDKEKLTVSVNSGSFVGKYMSYFSYLLFVDETDEYWTATSTDAVVSATLGLEDIGEGNLTLVGDFEGTFGEENYKFGSFYFGAFSAQTLSMENFLGALLQMYYPGLMKVPEESNAKAAPAMISRTQQLDIVPSLMKKQFKK